MSEPVVISAAEQELIPPDKMIQLTALVDRAGELEAEIERLDEELAEKSKSLQAILGGWQQPGQLVLLLQECHTLDITTTSGVRVCIDEELKPPSMAAGSKYREIVIEWAKGAGHGGIVTSEVTVNVPIGKEALADEVMKAAEAVGLQGKKFETINAARLKALLNGLLEDGLDCPLEQIGAFVFRKADILKAKVKK